MAELKYKVIKTRSQYKEYCTLLETLMFSSAKNRQTREEIELLTVLIEKWDTEHNSFEKLDPVELLQSLMTAHDMKAKDLVVLLGISKGYVSDILNFKKGLSKDVIRKLADYFKMSQEAFNRPYQLLAEDNSLLRNAS